MSSDNGTVRRRPLGTRFGPLVAGLFVFLLVVNQGTAGAEDPVDGSTLGSDPVAIVTDQVDSAVELVSQTTGIGSDTTTQDPGTTPDPTPSPTQDGGTVSQTTTKPAQQTGSGSDPTPDPPADTGTVTDTTTSLIQHASTLTAPITDSIPGPDTVADLTSDTTQALGIDRGEAAGTHSGPVAGMTQVVTRTGVRAPTRSTPVDFLGQLVDGTAPNSIFGSFFEGGNLTGTTFAMQTIGGTGASSSNLGSGHADQATGPGSSAPTIIAIVLMLAGLVLGAVGVRRQETTRISPLERVRPWLRAKTQRGSTKNWSRALRALYPALLAGKLQELWKARQPLREGLVRLVQRNRLG